MADLYHRDPKGNGFARSNFTASYYPLDGSSHETQTHTQRGYPNEL